MELHKVENIDFLVTSASRRDLAEHEREEDHPNIQDRVDYVRIEFKSNEQLKSVGVLYHRITTLEELKNIFVTYLKEEKHQLLKCKVEVYLAGRRYRVIWTPPYCLELQTTEIFWAARKNHATL